MKQKISELSYRMRSQRRGEISSLADSIKTLGVLEPVLVTPDGEVISGKRRVVAAKEAGLAEVPVSLWRNPAQARLAEIDANLQVLPLGEVEFDKQLAERKELFERDNGRRKGFVRATAKRLGVSKRTVEKSVQRATKAVMEVSVARESGLPASKVDELVKLAPKDQRRLIEFAMTHKLPALKKVVAVAKRSGVERALAELTVVDPALELKELIDRLETLLRDMIAGRLRYELHNGRTLKAATGLQMLLKHFVGMHKEESKGMRVAA